MRNATSKYFNGEHHLFTRSVALNYEPSISIAPWNLLLLVFGSLAKMLPTVRKVTRAKVWYWWIYPSDPIEWSIGPWLLKVFLYYMRHGKNNQTNFGQRLFVISQYCIELPESAPKKVSRRHSYMKCLSLSSLTPVGTGLAILFVQVLQECRQPVYSWCIDHLSPFVLLT